MGSFGVGKTFGGMVVTCMPNSGNGRPPGTPFKTIFGSYVGSHFPNIGYFKCIWAYMKVYKGIRGYTKVHEGI